MQILAQKLQRPGQPRLVSILLLPKEVFSDL
jgi:hypothetical protein